MKSSIACMRIPTTQQCGFQPREPKKLFARFCIFTQQLSPTLARSLAGFASDKHLNVMLGV